MPDGIEESSQVHGANLQMHPLHANAAMQSNVPSFGPTKVSSPAPDVSLQTTTMPDNSERNSSLPMFCPIEEISPVFEDSLQAQTVPNIPEMLSSLPVASRTKEWINSHGSETGAVKLIFV